MDLATVLADLHAESADLDDLVAPLPADAWSRPTPAEGWTIAHQIGHLAWTDEAAVLAATDPAGFGAMVDEALADAEGFVDRAADDIATTPPPELLARWRAGREALARALTALPDGARVPWFGPPMAPTSMATARLMETWAHGQDVADALGVERTATARLRHVAHIGVRARGFAYAARGRAAPDTDLHVALAAPDGEVWTWGPSDAEQQVTGPALDFCLLVTQRRHRDDLVVEARGTDAEEWLAIAQAFAGPPGEGRPPRSA